MTEHEKLKEICDKIWYNYDFIIWNPEWEHITYWKWEKWYKVYNDVREIIFTQEFMDKFIDKIWIDNIDFKEILFKKLDNPVEYLYNLL